MEARYGVVVQVDYEINKTALTLLVKVTNLGNGDVVSEIEYKFGNLSARRSEIVLKVQELIALYRTEHSSAIAMCDLEEDGIFDWLDTHEQRAINQRNVWEVQREKLDNRWWKWIDPTPREYFRYQEQ